MGRKNLAFDYSRYKDWIDPAEVTPYENNAKKHDDRQIRNIANSIKRFGWRQECVVTKDNVLVIGHGRRLAALELGCKMPYQVIDAEADELTEDDIRELREADNLTNAMTGFDADLLSMDFSELDFEGFDFEIGDFGFEDIPGGVSDTEPTADDKYSHETKIPQYEPSDNPPDVTQLIDTSKLDGMLEEIDGANLTKAEKRFLEIAAYRHAVIDFDKVADYYASARPEMQALMERSALVIIDINDAIANGYVQLSSALDSIMAEDAE